jgi:hypothetical protein
MKFATGIFVLSLLGLPSPGQINSPRIGTARYPDGTFHTVEGLHANMIVADLPLDPAQVASFSDSGGLIAQNGSIRLLSSAFAVVSEYPTGEKPLLSIDGDLTTALAWLPVSHILLHWDGTKFEALEVAESDIEGTVTDLQSAGSKQARLIVVHSDNTVSGVTVSLRTGNLVTSEPLPGVRGYTFGQGLFVVYAAEKELVVDNLRGYRRSVSLDAPDLVIERMSTSWLHLYSPSLQQNWALHLTQADLQLSLLPGLSAPSGVHAIATAARGANK